MAHAAKIIAAAFLLLPLPLFASGSTDRPAVQGGPPGDEAVRLEEIYVQADRAGLGLEGEPFTAERLERDSYDAGAYELGLFVAKALSPRLAIAGLSGVPSYAAFSGLRSTVLMYGLLPYRLFNSDLALSPAIGFDRVELRSRSSIIDVSGASAGSLSFWSDAVGEDRIDIGLINGAYPIDITPTGAQTANFPLWFDQQRGAFQIVRNLGSFGLKAAASFLRAADTWLVTEETTTSDSGRFSLAAALSGRYEYDGGRVSFNYRDSRDRDAFTLNQQATVVDREGHAGAALWEQGDLFLAGSRLESAIALVEWREKLTFSGLSTNQSRRTLDAAVDFRAPLNGIFSLIARASLGLRYEASALDFSDGGVPDLEAGFSLQTPIAFHRSLLFPSFRLDRAADGAFIPGASLSFFLVPTQIHRLRLILSSSSASPSYSDREGTLDGRFFGNTSLIPERDISAALGLELLNYHPAAFHLNLNGELAAHYRLNAFACYYDRSINAFKTRNVPEAFVPAVSFSFSGTYGDTWRFLLCSTLTPSFILRDLAASYALVSAPPLPGLALYSGACSLFYSNTLFSLSVGLRVEGGAALGAIGDDRLGPGASLDARFSYSPGGGLCLSATLDAPSPSVEAPPFTRSLASGPFHVDLGVSWNGR